MLESTELYRCLLGIESPWSVSSVDLDIEQGRVDVQVSHAKKSQFCCPKCDAMLSVYDHTEARTWRHLDSCQFQTHLKARIPRVNCPTHGVLQAHVPWALPSSRFTLLFELLAIRVLQAASTERARGLLLISWDEAFGIMERAVARGCAKKEARIVKKIGIDEKAIAKGHQYATLVCDLDRATIEYIGEGRKESSLAAWFEGLSATQKEGIEAISLDMWPAYIGACRTHIPHANQKMVFDRFHIMQHMLKGVDRVRKMEHKTLTKDGNTSLAGSKYLWLTNPENMKAGQQERFALLKKDELKTGRAWSIKEALRAFWQEPDEKHARLFWKRWYFWATHSRLKPIIDAAKTIKRHIENVLTYFTHKITNATAEGINSKIATLSKRAYGFRNKKNFITTVYFHCGGLDLKPTHRNVG